MNTQRSETKSSVTAVYHRSSFMYRTVASLVTVFFIFSGILMPASYANAVPITLNEAQQPVPAVTLDQANAQIPVQQAPIPSGNAIQNPSPLSSATQVQPQAVTVPSGWTRATSNANFAFTVTYQRVGSYSQYTLKLQDLRTGQVQDIATRMAPYGGFTDVYDVSPDGTTVIYAKTGPASPTPVPQTIYVQRIANPAQKISVAGELFSIVFNANGTATIAARTTYPSGTVIENLKTIRLSDLQLSASAEQKLITAGIDVVRYATEKVLVQIEKTPWAGNGNNGLIRIYDITNGTDHMRLVSENPFGSGYPATATIKLVSITTVNGQRIVSVAMDAYAGVSNYRTQWTYVTNVNTGAQLRIAGWAGSVVYKGSEAVYTVNLTVPAMYGETQTVRQVRVDLTTLTIIPNIPAGWTAVPSLPNLAYQVITGNRVRVMNLKTGVVSVTPSSQNKTGSRVGRYYIMTSTGLREIYQIFTLVVGQIILQSYDPVTGKWAPYTV